MTRLHVILIVLCLLVVTYFIGHSYGVDSVKPTVVETIKQVKGETQIVYKDRIVTRVITKIAKPDGTVITKETDKTQDIDETKDKKIVKNEDVKTVVPVDTTNNYELGVLYRVDSINELTSFNSKNVEVTAGRRIVGDVWVEGSASQKDVTFGLSYKWK